MRSLEESFFGVIDPRNGWSEEAVQKIDSFYKQLQSKGLPLEHPPEQRGNIRLFVCAIPNATD